MTAQNTDGPKGAPSKIVTTNTGRILRVNPGETAPTAPAAPPAGSSAHPVIIDPARRTDVLFRVRRDDGHELSAWWMIGAFVVTSGLVILLLSGVPGVA